MVRGQPPFTTVKDETKTVVWERYHFPAADIYLGGNGEAWVAARNTLSKPFCWSPTKTFYFGGKRFIALYPTIAWATKNFGWVSQRGPDGYVVIGRE